MASQFQQMKRVLNCNTNKYLMFIECQDYRIFKGAKLYVYVVV